jgi:hypothetical protein
MERHEKQEKDMLEKLKKVVETMKKLAAAEAERKKAEGKKTEGGRRRRRNRNRTRKVRK